MQRSLLVEVVEMAEWGVCRCERVEGEGGSDMGKKGEEGGTSKGGGGGGGG